MVVLWWYLLLKCKNQTAPQVFVEPFSGDSAGIQTRNLLIRSQMLYSVKLRNQTLLLLKRCKDTTFFVQSKNKTLFFSLFCYFVHVFPVAQKDFFYL